jgi:ectoine hydroxylase
MELTTQQIKQYRDNGYLLIRNLFSPAEVAVMLNEMGKVIQEDCPRRILEKNGAVRSFFAPESGSEIFNSVIRSGRLVAPAMQLIGEEVYLHQSKINSKYAMVGDWWEWHQDYTFWKQDDGMPEPDVLTAMIFLNDVNEFNGPMLMIPGSHKSGVLDGGERNLQESEESWFTKYRNSTSYMSALTSDLKYTLSQQAVMHWAERNGIVSGTGPKGTVLFFHGNLFHASSNNLSPWDRHTFLISYNSVRNTLPVLDNPRPEFIASRNFEPLPVAVAETVL